MLSGFFKRFPPRCYPWNERAACLTFQHRFACRVLVSNRDKSLRDLLHHSRVHVAMGRETAMTIAWTRPDNAHTVWGQRAFSTEDIEGPLTHGTSIVFASQHAFHHIPLIGTRPGRPLIIIGAGGEITGGIQPELL